LAWGYLRLGCHFARTILDHCLFGRILWVLARDPWRSPTAELEHPLVHRNVIVQAFGLLVWFKLHR
jgi:hypothetical protein